jgi:glycosyltransferase involved in cell wall biosynthesis
MTKLPITIVVPTKNEYSNIPGLLESLPPELQLIVLDDSSDGTDELVEELRPDNTRLVHFEGGVAHKRQVGAELAETEWVLFTDADVVFPPSYFDALPEHLEADGFFGPKLSAGGHEAYYRVFSAGQALFSRLGFPAGSGSNMGMRTEALKDIGGFDLDLPCNEDTDVLFRLKQHGYELKWVPELGVLNTDHRRLRRGAAWRVCHSLVRSTLLYISLYFPFSRRWLYSSWGYWK